MFKTIINGEQVEVMFDHQRAAYKGQLSRPALRAKKIFQAHNGPKEIEENIRVAVYAVTFCFINRLTRGVAYCSYADTKRYSKDTGRKMALRHALATVIPRKGKKDIKGAHARLVVWEDYFVHRGRQQVLGFTGNLRGILDGTCWWLRHTEGKITYEFKEDGLLTEVNPPTPTDKDELFQVPFKYSMPDEVINHLNQGDSQ